VKKGSLPEAEEKRKTSKNETVILCSEYKIVSNYTTNL
jgi:hypothetical protein